MKVLLKGYVFKVNEKSKECLKCGKPNCCCMHRQVYGGWLDGMMRSFDLQRSDLQWVE